MNILIEVLSVIGLTIWELTKAFFMVIWNNLPEIMQLRQLLGYFTPAGIVALWLGVPTFVVSIAIFVIKRIFAQR